MEGEQKEQKPVGPKEVYVTREGVPVKPFRKVFPEIDSRGELDLKKVTDSNTVVGEVLRTGKPASASVKQGK